MFRLLLWIACTPKRPVVEHLGTGVSAWICLLTGSALGGENALANKARYCNVAGCVNVAGQDPIAETGI